MKHFRPPVIYFSLMLLLLSAGCTGEAQPSVETPSATAELAATDFDRQQMMAHLTTGVIVPAHESFESTLAALETSAVTFADSPNLGTLETLQNNWLAANLARMHIIPYRLGPADDSLLHNRMDNRPPRTAFIDGGILAANDTINSDFLDTVGSSSVGLGAMEYLIFDPESGNQAVLNTFTESEAAARRVALVIALAQNLHQKGSELTAIWHDGYADEFMSGAMDGGDVNEPINMLLNQIVEQTEAIVSSNLGKPSGRRTNGEVRPDLVEAPYSRASLPRIIATVEGLQIAFDGGDGPGYDDYLDYLDATYGDRPLSAVIDERFEAALTALRAIEEPLEAAVVNNPEQVDAAIEAVREVLVLLKVDTVNQLGFTLTFSDNDGD